MERNFLMKKIFRRFLSLALALIMVFSVMPMSFAAEETTNVAKIGDTEYASLADAIAATKAGDTITFLADVTSYFKQRNSNNQECKL